MKNRNYFNQSAIIKMLVLVLVLLCDVPNAFAEKILKTEINGFQWYLNKRDYCYDVCTIDGKVIFHDVRDYDVLYSCCSKDDHGRFIFQKRLQNNDWKYYLYDSNGNFIANLDVSSIAVLKNEHCVKRFKDGNSYYFIIEDFISGSVGERYCLIDDNGRTIYSSNYEIRNSLFDKSPLSGCLLVEDVLAKVAGLIKLTGETIIPIEKETMIRGAGDLLYSNSGYSASILDRKGNIILDGAKKIICYEESNLFVVKYFGNKDGIYSFDKKWILSPDLGYEICYGFQGPKKVQYFYVREANSSLFGVISAVGKEVLPCEFEEIEYIGGNFLKFRSGDSWGVITLNSKVIIPTSRGYSSIGKYSSIQKTIPFKKPGYKGECNYLGRQISLVKDTQRTQSTTASATPAKSSTSKSSSAKNNSSSTRKYAFKLQEGKFYKIDKLVMDPESDNPTILPFEGEISLSKWDDGYAITFCQGDGNGNVETVEFYNATYSVEKGNSFYTLQGGFAQSGETGSIMILLRDNRDSALLSFYRTKEGKKLYHVLIMNATPFDNPVLKRN